MNGIRHRRGEANRRPDFIFPPSWIHTRDTYCTNPEGETVLEYLALRPLFVLWEKLPILPRASLVSHCSGTKNAHFSSYVRLEQVSLLLPLSSDKQRRQRIREKSLKGFHSGFWAPAISDPSILPFGQQLVLPQSGHQAPGLIAHFPSLA